MIKTGDIVYHGSYMPVEKPLMSKCRMWKDFGRGFYATTDEKQAEKFTRTAIKKAIADGFISNGTNTGYVSIFRYVDNNDMKVYQFEDANTDWLHCVVAHRKNAYQDILARWKDYDIIIGKIANDDTNLVITTYMDGLYGDIFSERADEIAIGFLEPDNLKDQICFRTQIAMDCLEYVESYEVKTR